MKNEKYINDLPTTAWGKLVLHYDLFRYDVAKVPDKICMWIAWKLPRRLVMWCAIRLMSHATTGPYGNQEPGKVSIMDALERWDNVNHDMPLPEENPREVMDRIVD